MFVFFAPADRHKKIAGICESRAEPTDTGEHIQIFDFQMILHHIPPIPKSSEKVRT